MYLTYYIYLCSGYKCILIDYNGGQREKEIRCDRRSRFYGNAVRFRLRWYLSGLQITEECERSKRVSRRWAEYVHIPYQHVSYRQVRRSFVFNVFTIVTEIITWYKITIARCELLFYFDAFFL